MGSFQIQPLQWAPLTVSKDWPRNGLKNRIADFFDVVQILPLNNRTSRLAHRQNEVRRCSNIQIWKGCLEFKII